MSLSWSRASRLHLPAPKLAPQIKKIIRTALETTLKMAPVRLPKLQKALDSRSDNLAFAIDISMVDDARIHALNRDFRSKNQPTDVLSFALWEDAGASGFDFPEFDFPDEEQEAIALGDIVISTQTAARQALEQNHAFEREIAFLTIHGALHLLGYDHGRDHARRVMFGRQDAIFEAIFLEVRR